jgi:hypothetical protein
VLGGFGFGAFIFGFVSRALVNPDGLANVGSRFPVEVTENVPYMLRMLVLIWAIIVAVSLCLIKPPPHSSHEEEKKEQPTTAINEPLLDEANKDTTTDEKVPSPVMQSLMSRQFILIYIMMLLSVCKSKLSLRSYPTYSPWILRCWSVQALWKLSPQR